MRGGDGEGVVWWLNCYVVFGEHFRHCEECETMTKQSVWRLRLPRRTSLLARNDGCGISILISIQQKGVSVIARRNSREDEAI